MTSSPDLAQLRFNNAMALFDEFVRNTVKHPDAATLRGLEGRFALRVQVQPSYWSQIKSRARQIGERLARQFEQAFHKPFGWMDQIHTSASLSASAAASNAATPAASKNGSAAGSYSLAALQGGSAEQSQSPASDERLSPHDDDERFIIGLVLTYYRRHPQRARTRLLDLLGEVLTPSGKFDDAMPSIHAPSQGKMAGKAYAETASEFRPLPTQAQTRSQTPLPTAPPQAVSADEAAHALWLRSQARVAPLKRKK